MVCAIGGAVIAALARGPQQIASVPDVNKRILAASLMVSCGRGWSTPAATTPNIDAFLDGDRESLGCDEVAPRLPTEPLGDFQRSSRYLIATIAGTWLLAGPSWRALDWLLGIWFAIAVVLAYATCRFVAGPWTAFAVALLIATSPLHLRALADIRDYSKAPVFLAALWCVARFSLGPPSSTIRAMTLAAAAGSVAGFGYGMRTDNIITLPLMLVAITFFWPDSWSASWRQRSLAALTCAVVFLLIAAPVGSAAGRGGVAAHWAILGLGPDFDRELGVTPGPYLLGTHYDDSAVATVVQAYAERRLGERQTIFLGTEPYSAASAAYYRQLVITFPADMVVRAVASVRRTLDLPFQSNPRVPGTRWDFLFRWRTAVLSRLEGIGFPLLAGAAVVTSIYSLQRAFLLGGVGVAMGAYPAIQYQPRHVFQLEFLLWFVIALIAGWLFRQRGVSPVSVPPRGAIRRVVASTLVVAVAGVALGFGSRAIQRQSVTRLFESYEQATTLPIPAPPPSNGKWRSVLDRNGLRSGAEPAQSVASDMLVLDIGGSACGSEQVRLRLTYVDSPLGTAFSREREVALPRAAPSARVFQPIFETGLKNPEPGLLRLQRVETPVETASCIQRVAKFETAEPFALLLPAVLPADWRNRPLHQRLSRWR